MDAGAAVDSGAERWIESWPHLAGLKGPSVRARDFEDVSAGLGSGDEIVPAGRALGLVLAETL